MPAPRTAFRFGRFECKEYLGGGMTDVYRAWDTRLEREVALKILRDDAGPDMRQRFAREAQLACRCRHENIIITYDAGEWEGRPYMVMEFLEAQSLRSAIDRGELQDEQRILRIAYDIAGALEHVHSLGIIHRDIKPANICLDSSGKVKLIDFGIAKTPDWDQTAANVSIGTLLYMAPEQLTGKSVSAGIDIYAFGVLLFEMLTGRKLVRAENYQDAFVEIVTRQPDLTPLDRQGVSPAVKALVARCLEKHPERRWATFTEVRAAIAPLLATTTPPTQVVKRKPSRTMILTAAAVALAFLLVLVLWFSRSGQASKSEMLEPVKLRHPLHLSDPSGDMVLVDGAFYLDRTEVSNRAYRLFCERTGAAFPEGMRQADPDAPVVNVSLEDAKAFARWANKRLPTAAEWERAARGAEGRLFPWGNQADPAAANIARSKGRLEAVGSYQKGATPNGILNLVGNVWEWVDTPAQPDDRQFAESRKELPALLPPPSRTEPFYQLRGGSFRSILPLEDWARFVYDFSVMPARAKLPDLGFRCARSVDQ